MRVRARVGARVRVRVRVRVSVPTEALREHLGDVGYPLLSLRRDFLTRVEVLGAGLQADLVRARVRVRVRVRVRARVRVRVRVG